MKRLAVVGYPVEHSRSPEMQNAALAAMGLSGEWEYGRIPVAPEEFEELIRSLPAKGYEGVNVTIPHKERALRIAATSSAEAKVIGAANTLSFQEGQIRAANTDAIGLERSYPRGSPRGVKALVLGAGGAARAAVWAFAEVGAVVSVWNRTESRARDLFAELATFVELGGAVDPDPDSSRFGVIVNATAVGLHDEDPFDQLPLRRDAFDGQVVIDMVYGDGPTRLLVEAKRHGATVVDGREVLVQQGARALELWTGREVPVAAMRKALHIT